MIDLKEFKRENSEIGENEQDFTGRIKSSDPNELSLSYENGERKEEKKKTFYRIHVNGDA